MRRKLFVERLEDRRVLAADFNGDETVDDVDLRDWKFNFGATTATSTQGDADGDSDVDGADFLQWQRESGPTQNNLIPYRPQGVHALENAADAPAYDPFPRRPVRAVDETSNTLGPGIRINGDDDNNNGTEDRNDTGEIDRENDLIEVKVDRMPGTGDLVLVAAPQLRLYYDYDKETPVPLNNDETATEPLAFDNDRVSVWVEWTSSTHGFANLSLVNPSDSSTLDTVRFHSFKSLIVAFGGRTQDPADTDGDGNIGDVTDGGANREGLYDIAQSMYNTGWDVLAFDEEEIDLPVNNDPSKSIPYLEILSGHQSRFLEAHAVMGYSQGGGAANDLVEALYANAELITRMVVYLDAVQQDFILPENEWPEVTFFTLNIYELVVEFPLGLGGADIDDGEPAIYGATMEEIDTTNDPGWNNNLDHFDIDDDPQVQQRIRTRLQEYLFEGR